MDYDTLRKAQLLELNILKEVRRICNKHHISYWLESGTLLGAVRHGGFIPWDDDLDIGMLRKDYNKFVKVAPNELNPRFILQNWDITNGYYFPFAKVRLKGTVWQEMKAPKLKDNGIYIDIFPFDVFPSDTKSQRKQHYPIDILKRAIAVKYGDRAWISGKGMNWKRFIRYVPAIILSPFISEKSKKTCDYIQCLFNGRLEFTAYFPAGVSQYGNWKVKREYVDNLTTIKFEDDTFSCPSNYDLYLTDCYGDYNILPPEDQRMAGHSITEIDFGEN